MELNYVNWAAEHRSELLDSSMISMRESNMLKRMPT
jgi:hypothetical protein